ncbi:hypothetical protein GCM10010277_47140 [Streptomyces longisporoflavus]|uniref:hypothetical protein n=1 Tax=Streptomyces longisporoflavus TaxID=28044 RepID=UPI00167D245A|nr:hypothetical protein [Streptomyces longisporoflavus]GGV51443.1 hypothetical protein GCM10010277_47140 [Streptomyces longisporoflavus]
MRLGKALATGIAEEAPQDRLRQEQPEQPERHEQSERPTEAESEQVAAAGRPAADRPVAGVPAVR